MRVNNRSRPTIGHVLTHGQPMIHARGLRYRGKEYLLSDLERIGIQLGVETYGYDARKGGMRAIVSPIVARKRWPSPAVYHELVVSFTVHGDQVVARQRPRSRHIHRRPRPQGRKFRRQQFRGLLIQGVSYADAQRAVMEFHHMKDLDFKPVPLFQSDPVDTRRCYGGREWK